MSDRTSRARDDDASEDFRLRIASYRPRGLHPAECEAIRPFVTECAGRLPVAGWPSTTRALRVLSELVAWAVSEGMTLDPESILDPDTVERFVTQGLHADTSRATYRSVLRRIGPLLTRKAPWEPRPARLARRQVAQPYTRAEVETLSRTAGRQSTPAKVRAARALLALGAGAGLDGRWVTRVKAEDITVDGSVLLICVSDPAARAVPVLALWEREVVQLASTAGDEYLVGGNSTSRNRASALASGLEIPPGHPRLSAARLRSTWLLWHLEAGTRLPELAVAAGLKGITVLSDLLHAVPTRGEHDTRNMLRGAAG
jgi:integrase